MSNNGLPATWPDGTARDHWFSHNNDENNKTDQELASQPHGNKYYDPDYARQQLQKMGLDSSGDDETVLDRYHREIATVYVQAFEKDGLIGIQYWFYYVFHDDPGQDPHPHDWWYFWVVYDESEYRPTTVVFDFHHNLRALDFNDDRVQRDGFFHVKTYHDAGGHRAMYAPGGDVDLITALKVARYIEGDPWYFDLVSLLSPIVGGTNLITYPASINDVLGNDATPETDEIIGLMVKLFWFRGLMGEDGPASWRNTGILRDVADWNVGNQYNVEDFKHWVWVYGVDETDDEEDSDKVYFTGDNFLPPSCGEYDMWPKRHYLNDLEISTYLPWMSWKSWAKGNPDTNMLISSTELVWKWWAYYYDWDGIKYPSARTRYYDGSTTG